MDETVSPTKRELGEVNMAHELEQFSDGSTAFVAVRENAWHKLGTVLDNPTATTAEFMEIANLANWNVRLEPLTAVVEGVEVEIPERNAVVRTNPVSGQVDGISVVGTRYQVVQNEQLFNFGEAILEESDSATWETAGSIKNGRVVFGSMKLGEDMLINGQDAVGKYLLLSSSHDGSTGVIAAVTPVRTVCSNTLRYALDNHESYFKARHTASIDGRIQDAKRALGITYKWFDEFEATATALSDRTVNDAKFEEIINSVFGVPSEDDSLSSHTRYENRTNTLFDIWNGEGADGDSMQGIGGTAWGALNAITEYADWYSGHDGTRLERAGGLLESADKIRSKAYNRVLTLTS